MQPARPSMAIRSSLNETSFDNCLFWTKNSWGGMLCCRIGEQWSCCGCSCAKDGLSRIPSIFHETHWPPWTRFLNNGLTLVSLLLIWSHHPIWPNHCVLGLMRGPKPYIISVSKLKLMMLSTCKKLAVPQLTLFENPLKSEQKLSSHHSRAQLG